MLRHWFLGSLMTSCCLISILWSLPGQTCGLGSAIRNRSLAEWDSLVEWDRLSHPTTDILPKTTALNEGQTIAQQVTRSTLSRPIWASRDVLSLARRYPMAHRCGEAPHAGYQLVALLPEPVYGQSISATPTVFVYVPPTYGLQAEFIVYEDEDRVVVTKELTLPEGAGIIALNTAVRDRDVTLEPGKLYEWILSIVVDPQDRSSDVYVGGSIERVEPEPQLVTRLAHSADSDRPLHLAEAGLWYDTLTTLYTLRQTHPNNSHYINQLRQVLESVELEYLADKPLIAEF